MRSARRWTVLAGVFGGLAVVLIPLGGLDAWDAIWAAGFGGSGVMATFRWWDYRQASREMSRADQQQIQSGMSSLSFEAQTIAHALAGKIRSGRMSARFRNSAAGPAFHRLERAARAFDDVAAALDNSASDVLDDVHTSQRALVELAGDVQAVEKSMAVASPERRDSLRLTQQLMVERLDAGVTAYEETVTAAAQVVAEQGALDGVMAAGVDPTMARLNESSAKLHGLAEGIGEMRKFHDGMRPPA